jgi:hypothetical protein
MQEKLIFLSSEIYRVLSQDGQLVADLKKLKLITLVRNLKRQKEY